jgi:RimJ/RimL family protein N-acetyltransferase
MKQLATDRLRIRRMTVADAEFILQLLNEPSWLRFIGDRNVHTLDDARTYVSGPMDMYSRLGIGLCIVEMNGAATPVGICGLTKRDYLEDIDLGFAFLPHHWGQGYAREAASEVLRYGKEELKLKRVVATTRLDNLASQVLLDRIGFQFESLIVRPDTQRTLRLYAVNY